MKKWIYSGTREEQPSERELMHGKLAKKAASEGIVLLKNEGILPLKKDTAAALLGYGAEKTVKVELVLEMLTTERIFPFIRD